VTLGGVGLAGALSLAALHPSLEHSSLAEILQLLEFPFEIFEAPPMTFQRRQLRGSR
jgi:hypothetical protein